MTESARHRGTAPPNPHQAIPSQQHPLGEWDHASPYDPGGEDEPRPAEQTETEQAGRPDDPEPTPGR